MRPSEPDRARKEGVVAVPAAHGVEFLVMAQIEDQWRLADQRRIGEPTADSVDAALEGAEKCAGTGIAGDWR